MKKAELLNQMLENNNGYLFTTEVVSSGISKTYLTKFVKTNGLERVAQGIYISADTWEDELFILQKRYPAIVFDGETALYLHGLTDREYSEVHVGVPKGFNPYRLKEKGIIVHTYSDEVYLLGIAEMQTNFHNKVRVYDRERCICNIIVARPDVEVQTFQTAMKEYMSDSKKRLSVLLEYATKLQMRDEVMKYVEVML